VAARTKPEAILAAAGPRSISADLPLLFQHPAGNGAVERPFQPAVRSGNGTAAAG